MPRNGWLAVGAVAAALAVGVHDQRLTVAAVAAVVAAGALAIGWLRSARRAVAAIAIGASLILLRATLIGAPPAPDGAPVGSGPWAMVVESMTSPRAGGQVATLRTLDGGAAGFRLAATLPRYPSVEPGDVVDVEGRPRARPEGPYGDYLERIGAWGTLDARGLVVRARPVDAGRILERARRDAGDALTRVLPEPEAGLAAGILIGLRDRVDRTVAAAFTTAGVSHVVAISGWNIAIVAAAIAAVSGRVGRRRRAIVTSLAVVAYIDFAGASPSVLRAGAMAGVALVARETGRASRAAAALSWAVVVLLLADPDLVGDAGFQLSSLATAGLIVWATPLSRRIESLGGGRCPRWLAESLGVSLAAQVATLPVVLAAFGRLAIIAPAVNLAVVPLVAPAMAAGVVALAGGILVGLGAPGAVGSVVAAPAWVALRLIIAIVDAGAALPFVSVSVESSVGAAAGLAFAGLISVVLVRRRHRPGSRAPGPPSAATPRTTTVIRSARAPTAPLPLRLATIGLVTTLVVAGAVVVTRREAAARVTVLDVGQGDAILVEGSRGGRLLVDGGPDPDRLLIELDRRLPPWDRRIDVVILSHPHEDHVAGLALLLGRYRIGRVLEPGMRGPGPGYSAWSRALAKAGAPDRRSIAAGDRLAVDDIDLRVLWPIRGQVPPEPPDTGTGINNVSVVLLGAVAGRRFLLAGDVERDIDPRLLSEGLPRIDLLKVAHHGSRTATTEPFVEAVRAMVAIASAGTGNPYGHPARSTLDRLAAAGARVYRTDRDGSVAVTFDTAGMSVRTEPDRQAARAAAPSTRATPPRAILAATSGPRPAFGCAIPLPDVARRTLTPTSAPESAPASADVTRPSLTPSPLESARSSGSIATLLYHRPDDRQPRPPDQPAAVRLGRRRTARGPAGRPLRPRHGRGRRQPARALGPAGAAPDRGR
jgi:competence protein ComEC